MCCDDGFLKVPQMSNFMNRGCFSINSFLGALFVCSPCSESQACHDCCCCGSILWIISLPFRFFLGCMLFMIGLFIDAAFFALFLVTFCWCCGSCHKWGCEYCCNIEDRVATDCIVTCCIFEAV